MTFPIQSIELFDINNFPDGAMSAADLANLTALFQDYKNLGVNTVTLGWGVPVDENTGALASSFGSDVVENHAASLSEIQAIANAASQLGLSVILKPQAQTMDIVASEGDIDNINTYSITSPTFNANTFLTQWATYMRSVGSLAQDVHASMVVVGTENAGYDTAAYLPQWTNIIESTRSTYSGPLTYASFNDPTDVSFWSQLTMIGIDAYYGLTPLSNPTYQDVLAGWTNNSVSGTEETLGATSLPVNIVSTLQALSTEYKEPLYFSEFGGQSFHGVVNEAAGGGPADKVADWQQQEWLYQSAFQAMSGSNASQWFDGVNMWAIYTGSVPESSASFASYLATDPTDFDVRGKPAALVVASWFGAKDYLTAMENSFTGSIANDQICLYGNGVPVTAGSHLSQAATFNTVVSVTMDGTIMNGQAPTVHFYVNGVDEGAQALSTTPGTYVDPQGVAWSADQTFTFTLSGLVNVNQLEIAIDSPLNVGGVENSQTFVAAASVNGVSLTNETYTPLVGQAQTLPITQGGQNDGGNVVLDASPWNTQLESRTIGTASNPIQVNGGGGTDTVYVLGQSSDYTIAEDASGAWHLTENSGLNQNATLTGVSYVDFQDGSQITLGSGGGLIGSMPVGQQMELIYLGYFDRAADPGGFGFWEAQDGRAEASGQSAAVALTNIANSFTPQSETQALYPFLANPNPNFSDPTVQAGLTTFIENVYGNLFGRAADSSGLAYWVGQIENGSVGLGAAVLAIANGTLGSDANILQNKLTVALDFTNSTMTANLQPNATLLAEAKTVLTSVDDLSLNDASVTAAEALIAPWIASQPQASSVATVGVAPSGEHLGLV